MNELLLRLNEKERAGSKPRCHWLTHGQAGIAERLNGLLEGHGSVSSDDIWMPCGFEQITEAQLHKTPHLLSDEHCQTLTRWWLAVGDQRTRTPCIDIASTCTIDDQKGILIVEAKAHTYELDKEEAGKSQKPDDKLNTRRNFLRIGCCIDEANLALSDQTGLCWKLSRDHHYQMSNRFAWAWKLTELGYPVVVVYLGFLNAEEMRSGPSKRPFLSNKEWETCVKSHSKSLFPESVWGSRHIVHGQPFISLIKSLDISYDSLISEAT
ncbi:hypothetical protein [Gimesia aquarii]|uniref:Uncharacterized protein n=1 Tax=Gimesia aquarii TaxID=2527964 RepID=A0A517WWJ6_9PLAN|nr:hypothetical protein [Gimesia aquarii]QDU09643.1 hypothetical protein V202x_30190 [Gimesia aquarii]